MKERKKIRQTSTATQQILTVAQYAALYGKTERAAWMDIYRGKVPYRRHSRKIILIRSEVEEFFRSLPGVTVEQAAKKIKERAA